MGCESESKAERGTEREELSLTKGGGGDYMKEINMSGRDERDEEAQIHI